MININSDEKLPLVVCECGVKLLIIPDMDEMTRSIKAHAITHRKAKNEPEKAQAEYCRVEELLAQKVLVSICKRSPNKLE
jgi:hypothetical protein